MNSEKDIAFSAQNSVMQVVKLRPHSNAPWLERNKETGVPRFGGKEQMKGLEKMASLDA